VLAVGDARECGELRAGVRMCNPSHFGSESFNVVFLLIEDIFRYEHRE
jgi:hypothetical protein